MNKATSRKVKGLMVERGLIQADVARELKMSEHSVFNKLNGRTSFTPKEIMAFADLLKVDRGYFFNLIVDESETIN